MANRLPSPALTNRIKVILIMTEGLKGLAGHSGIEKIEAIIRGEVPYAPMMQTLPAKVVYVEKGLVRMHAFPNDSHMNLQGVVHGGFAATIIDTVTGFAVLSALDDGGVGSSTIDLAVKMLKPVKPDTTLIAEGRIIKAGRTIAVADATITDAEGSIYAHGTTTYMLKQLG